MITDALKSRISVLSQLAIADGEFDTRELAFIYRVCIRHNIDVDSIGDIITEPQPVLCLNGLTEEDKFSYLVDILSLMMIDGKILPREVHFCLDISARLGFSQEAVRAFIDEMSARPEIDEVYIKESVSRLSLTRE